jgi:hypothetical protein
VSDELMNYAELEAHYRAKYPDGNLPENVTALLSAVRRAEGVYVPYVDEVHRSDLIAAAEEAGEIGHRSENGRNVRWDDLLEEWERHMGVDLGGEDDSAPIRLFKKHYRKAWREANE